MDNLLKDSSKWEREFSRAAETTVAVVTSYGLRIIGAVIILLAGYTVARLVRRAMVKTGRRTGRVDMTVVTFVASLVHYGILAFTIVAMLSSFGVETTSVVAVLGAAGLAIGLALQGTLGHVASGFMLILFRPFRVGDAVETAGVSGVVTELTLFTTEITSGDNIRIIVPNSAVWSGVTKNLTRNQTRRSDFDIVISYQDDIDAALKIVGELIAADPKILAQPSPVTGVSKLSDRGIHLLIWVWSAVADMQAIQFGLNKSIAQAFAAAGITIPYPHRIVHAAATKD